MGEEFPHSCENDFRFRALDGGAFCSGRSEDVPEPGFVVDDLEEGVVGGLAVFVLLAG